MRYFYVFSRLWSEGATEEAMIAMSNIGKTGHNDGGSSSGRVAKVWLAGAACLAVAGLVCTALLWKGPSAPADRSGGAGSDISVPDVTAPRLLGIRDLTVAQNGTVSYREGVSAEDDVDGPVAVQIDAAAVDLTVPGEYPVIYTAQDAAGNKAEQTATVTVVETPTVDQGQDEQTEDEPAGGTGGGGVSLDQVTQEDVDALADKILGRITNSGMSQREKARAIFNYVNRNIKYVGSSDKSSWIVGAYVGFTRGRGDCYNYYACSKALLTKAGISNVDLTRVGGNSRHYWQLVNTGDGWYHFDACPHPNGYPLYAFMITEAQARAYTEQVKSARLNYYVYDYASCPVAVEGMPEEVPEQPQPPVEGEEPGETQDPGVGEGPGGDPTQPGEGEGPSVNPAQPGEGETPGDEMDPTAPPPDQSGEGQTAIDELDPMAPPPDESREGDALAT